MKQTVDKLAWGVFRFSYQAYKWAERFNLLVPGGSDPISQLATNFASLIPFRAALLPEGCLLELTSVGLTGSPADGYPADGYTYDGINNGATPKVYKQGVPNDCRPCVQGYMYTAEGAKAPFLVRPVGDEIITDSKLQINIGGLVTAGTALPANPTNSNSLNTLLLKYLQSLMVVTVWGRKNYANSGIPLDSAKPFIFAPWARGVYNKASSRAMGSSWRLAKGHK